MITHHELKELSALSLSNNQIVSLYLNVSPHDNPKGDFTVTLKNLTKSALSTLDTQAQNSVRADLDKIEHFFADRPDGLKRGLALFSCQAMGLWKLYSTMLPFENNMVIARSPFLKPLLAMADLYQNYLALVVGKTKARLLVTSFGEIQELTSIYAPPNENDSGRDGSTGDMAVLRAKRAEEKVQRIVHKDAIKAAEQVLKEENIKRILLGGTDEGRGRFKEAMPQNMRERVVSEFRVDRNASDHEILENLLPLMKEVEHSFERKALQELFDQNGKYVIGLSDVLTALQQGNVHKMYALTDATEPGMVCLQCGALTPMRDRPCPYCGGVMQVVPHMLNLAISKAIEQGARVDMLTEAPQLEQAGGIGALLRF